MKKDKNVSGKKALDLDAALELVAKSLKPLAMKDEEYTTANCSSPGSCGHTNDQVCYEE